MKTWKKVCLWLLVPPVLLAAAAAWFLWGGISNPAGRKTIGDIAVPAGYQRVAVDSGSFGEFLRNFPLERCWTRIRYYDGSLAYCQYLGYAVLDLPVFGPDEQCADVAMRLQAEYLWSQGRYGEIRFRSVNGENLPYTGGSDRKAFERYLRKVYGKANTASLRKQLGQKPVTDIAPGDVLVYTDPDFYGHAVTVVDVAVNRKTGAVAVLLAEGSMPAQSAHIARNITRPFFSPWMKLDLEDSCLLASGFLHFDRSDLRSW